MTQRQSSLSIQSAYRGVVTAQMVSVAAAGLSQHGRRSQRRANGGTSRMMATRPLPFVFEGENTPQSPQQAAPQKKKKKKASPSSHIAVVRGGDATRFSTMFPLEKPGSSGFPFVFCDPDGTPNPNAGFGSSDEELPEAVQRIREITVDLVHRGYLADAQQTRRLDVMRLGRMGYDDALLWQEWRLELLYLDTGQPHFRLYWCGILFGVVGIATSHADLGSARMLDAQRRLLAAYLVGWGWTFDTAQLVRDGALTPYNANTDHTYRLFEVEAKRRVDRVYDMLRSEEE